MIIVGGLILGRNPGTTMIDAFSPSTQLMIDNTRRRRMPCYGASVEKRRLAAITNVNIREKKTMQLSTALQAQARLDYNKDDEDGTTTPQQQQQQAAIWMLPWCLGAAAFCLYQPTAVAFRKCIEHASHSTGYMTEQGVVYQAELIVPALNGPVVTSISILFATLSAITISSLYTRQDTMHRTLVAMVEDVLHLQLLLHVYQEPFQREAQQILGTFADHIYDLCVQGELCPRAIRKEHLGALVRLVNTMGMDAPVVRDAVLKESYETVDRINGHRATLSSALSANFPFFHYFNLVALAVSICLIFLLETDMDVVLLLAGLQLGTCWSLLVGTFSMLACVCYDMATPFSGIFQVRVLLQCSPASEDRTNCCTVRLRVGICSGYPEYHPRQPVTAFLSLILSLRSLTPLIWRG